MAVGAEEGLNEDTQVTQHYPSLRVAVGHPWKPPPRLPPSSSIAPSLLLAAPFISLLRPSFRPISTHSPSLPFVRLRNQLRWSLSYPPTRPGSELRSAVEVQSLQDEPAKTQDQDSNGIKLYVVNLPWTFPATSVQDMFSECGSVVQIEMVKDNRGRNKGYGFVTMRTREEAQAAIDKFNNTEISERVIRVEYARTSNPQSPTPAPVRETPHKLYVSNLQWKVRTNHLREFFLPEFNPVSARVVFESSPRRSAGYGFASFATQAEAEAAVASLNGKELMGRPIILKISEPKSEEPGGEEEENVDNQDAPMNDEQHEAPQDAS